MAITVFPRDDRDSIINTEDFSRTKHPITVREVPRHVEDLTGKIFTRLTVLRICSYSPTGAKWWCRCSCERGTEKAIFASKLVAEKIKSCGCLMRECQAAIKTRNPLHKNGENHERKFITIDGKTQLLCQWQCELGVSHSTYRRRIARGWSVEDALKIPVQVGATDDRNERLKKAKLDREH